MTEAERKAKRQWRETKWGPRYNEAPEGPCVYCDGPSKVRDHVPALVNMYRLPQSTLAWLYPACSTCNRWLSAHKANCLADRWLHLRKRLGELVAEGRQEFAATLRAIEGRSGPQQITQRCLCNSCVIARVSHGKPERRAGTEGTGERASPG